MATTFRDVSASPTLVDGILVIDFFDGRMLIFVGNPVSDGYVSGDSVLSEGG